MSEYIEREKAIDYLMEIIDRPNHPEWLWTDEICGSLNAIPAADVRPVVRGRWNRTDAYPHRLYCSVCYNTYLKNDELLERWEFPLNYCPNCGAKMEES